MMAFLPSLPRRPRAFFLFLAIASVALADSVTLRAADYDIVYVRAPRYGDEQRVGFPEVTHPIDAPAGSDLVLLHADGTEEVLVSGGDGAVIDPYPSFDGEWIYYAKFHDQRTEAKDRQRPGHPSRAGADIFKLHVPTRTIVQLTFQEWTPNTGLIDWSHDPLSADENGRYYLGYGIFNLGPCPLPDGRLMFTSSRNAFIPNQDFTAPNQQLFVMDEDGKNVELIGHFNLGSALHPTVLTDGRVMFSTYEAQGLRDRRIWGLWSIWPDGRQWEPLMSAFTSPSAFHFQTQLSNGDLSVVEYYNQNDNGFGTLLAFDGSPDPSQPLFGAPNAGDTSNPAVQRGIWWFNDQHPSHKKPRYKQYSFSPQGLYGLTLFAHGEDNASSRDLNGDWAGKVTHPAGAPNNDVLLVWTPGPANDLNRPTNRPVYDAGIYRIVGGLPVDDHADLDLVKNDPNYNELQPRALVPYQDIYGIAEPAALPENQNDGSAHPSLAPGSPFGLVGSSTFYRRDTFPGRGRAEFDGLDPFNTSQNGASSNWSWQGADAGKYSNADIHAVRILAMEPSSHLGRGPGIGNGRFRGFYNHAQERLRILGEIPLRKTDANGQPVLDPDGNSDTSFLAKIPADTPFTFQTLDRDGLVLNMSQTWHQVRPGEVRANCGGCHAHSQMPMDFSLTAAAQPNYSVVDLALRTPLISKDEQGAAVTRVQPEQAVDVEYYRDIKPILHRSCVGCHSLEGPAEAQLVLDDESVVDGLENTYNRLARDSRAEYGIKPVIRNGQWRQTNASRYVRKFQSRRSLLIWKLFGRRLDGWTNEDHPTESVPGDPTTLPPGADTNQADLDFTGTIMPPPGSGYPPLSEDEKILFARWIDLGAPISYPDGVRAQIGWFADDLRPTLDLSLPRRGHHEEPVTTIRLGAFDYYSGLDRTTLSVTANFPVNGRAPGSELEDLFEETADHVWSLSLASPITQAEAAEIRVGIQDATGNLTEIVRSFSVAVPVVEPPMPLPPTGLTAVLGEGTGVLVSWQAPSGGADRYRVYRDSAVIGETSELQFVDLEPPTGTSVQYSVASANADGAQSELAHSAPLAIPEPPQGPLLLDAFDPVNTAQWTFVDQGDLGGPSDWQLLGGELAQFSNIYALGLNFYRRGTMAIWNAPEAYAWRDYRMVVQLTSLDDDGIGLQFHYQDPENFYRLDLDHLQAYRRLVRVVDGVPTLLAGIYGGPPLGQAFELMVQVVGDQITIQLDGRDVFPDAITDGQLSHGTIGLFSFANEGAHFHNLIVQPPAEKASSPSALLGRGKPEPGLGQGGRPQLQIEPAQHGIRIHWRDPGTAWGLESKQQLDGRSAWVPFTQPVSELGDVRYVDVQPNLEQSYYRLVLRDGS